MTPLVPGPVLSISSMIRGKPPVTSFLYSDVSDVNMNNMLISWKVLNHIIQQPDG